LESSFNRTKQFTADASHELRTPLTILKGETEIALKTEKTVEGLKAVLKSNLEEINHLVDMVKKLLFLSKEDVKTGDMPMETIELDKLLLEKYQQTKVLAEEKGVTMSLLRNDRVRVKGDPYRLKELLLNLIENAVKYTPAGGDVALTLEGSNGFAKIIVADTGIGISKEDCPRVFDRFYRVDKSRVRSEGGSGLGLNICKQIVEAHKGGITLESELGKGSSFIVQLPSS
jgi:signal transduction histidine kinase